MKTARIRDSLRITVPARTFYNEKTEEWSRTEDTTLTLVHSLISVSMWESKYHKAFLSDRYEKTTEMIRDYIKCMTIGPEPDPLVYMALTNENMQAVQDYISNPMTASYLRDDPNQNSFGQSESMTSELIYYWMRSLNIWLDCERWHLNRLLTLIKVTNRKEQAAQNKEKNKKGGSAPHHRKH